jgi:hypothetical protein
MEVRKIIPPQGDIREWIISQRKAGKTREEQRAALLAMRNASEVYTKERAIKEETSADDAILAELGLEVIGDDDDGKIEVYSTNTRKFTKLYNLDKIGMPRLVHLGGRIIREKVHEGAEARAGMYSLKEIRILLGDAASRARRLGVTAKRGPGIWDCQGEIVLVGDGQLAVWDGRELHATTKPRRANQLYKTDGNPSWFDADDLPTIIKGVSVPAVISHCETILNRWRWYFPDAPRLVTGLILATWVQSLWDWRPQVVITGRRKTGKSVLFGTMDKLFSGLAIKSSDSTAAGIRQHIQSSAAIALLDEWDSTKERQALIKMVRASGRGDQRITGTGAQHSHAGSLRQIFWMGGRDTGLDRDVDENRFIRIELLEARSEDEGKLSEPPEEECRYLGQRLLAVAVQAAREAKRLAGELRTAKVRGIDSRIVETYAVPAAMLAIAVGSDASQELDTLLWNLQRDSEAESDEEGLLGAIWGSHVDAGRDLGRRAVGQLLEIADDATANDRADAVEALAKVGIELRENSILIAQGFASRHLLGRTEWKARNISEILLRLPGAKKRRARISGTLNRCVEIPGKYFFGDENGENEREKSGGEYF